MKIAIINDTHAGVGNASDIFINSAEKFYRDVFFPYLLKHGITKIIHLGDYFDNRRAINVKCLKRDKEMFLDKLVEYGMSMDIILGNHDVYFKSTNELSATVSLLSKYPEIVTIIEDPTIVEYDSFPIAFLPWVNPTNEQASLEFVESASSKASMLLGHLELGGFEMMRGGILSSTSHGMPATLFKRFETVLSGHFHTKSTRGNVTYLGTQFELTWSDCNDHKYFHILDTAKREIEPIRNPNTLFNKIKYDDSSTGDDITGVLDAMGDFSFIEGTFVKVIVESKKNPYLFDKFINRLMKFSPHDLKIIEAMDEYLSENISDANLELTDTLTLLNTYVEAVDTTLDKGIIVKKLAALYNEAQTIV